MPKDSDGLPSMDGLFPLQPTTVETDADIGRSIALLSALLRGHRAGKSTVLDAKQAGGSSADLWSHVSYALDTGGSGDPNGNEGVAVVGRIEPGCVTATVVAPNASRENARTKPVEVDAVDFLGFREVTSMLNDIFETLPDDVEFDVHLRDAMSIVSYLLHRRTRLDKAVTAFYLFDFIVLRCYRKLYARLASGVTLWTQHPLEALRDFYEQSSDPMALGQASTASTQESAVAPDSLLSFQMPLAYLYICLLDEHGIGYDEDKSGHVRVTFSSSNAAAWAKLVGTCYTTIFNTLSHPSVVLDPETQDTNTTRVARRPANMPELRVLHSALAVLDDVIRTDLIKHLFRDDLVQGIDEHYTTFMGHKAKPRLVRAISRATNVHPAAEDDPKTEYHYDPDDLKADGEDSRHHIIRHLRALTIPLRAAISIVDSCFSAPHDIATLRAYQVVVAPGSQTVITPEYLDRFMAEYARRWGPGEGSRVAEILAGSRGAVLNVNASVHAEAALMSLVNGDLQEFEVDVDGTPTPIASLLPSGRIPVGVSKRCCFCCSLLDELLQPEPWSCAAKSRLILRGTHGAICPWSPPHGVPRQVLEAMRKKLLTIFNDAFSTLRAKASESYAESGREQGQGQGQEPPPSTRNLWRVPPTEFVPPRLTFD